MRRAGADMILCMSIEPGYSGQAFMPDAYDGSRQRALLVDMHVQVDGGVGAKNVRAVARPGAEPARRGQRHLRRETDHAARTARLAARRRA